MAGSGERITDEPGLAGSSMVWINTSAPTNSIAPVIMIRMELGATSFANAFSPPRMALHWALGSIRSPQKAYRQSVKSRDLIPA
jgi:hypothetical protein